MTEPNLPEGYSLKKKEINGREFTYLRNEEEKIVLALPTEHCPLQRIEEVIQQIKGFQFKFI